MNKIIEENKKSITKDAEELFKEFPTTALLPYELQVKELKLFKHEKKDVVSVRMTIRVYTGGAHGNYFYYSWNWSKTKKRFLSLDDVITPPQFPLVVKLARDILFKKQKKYGDESIEGQKEWIQRGTSKKEDFKVWNFDGSGIVFVFPEYQIAPYAAGSFEVYIPLDSLQ